VVNIRLTHFPLQQTRHFPEWQANYWRAQYEPLVEREAALKAEIEASQATIRDLTQRLYGTKSEKATRPNTAGEPTSASPRKRGQQPGRPGRGRRACATLPVVDEVRDLSTTEKRCPSCGEAFRPFPGPEACTIIAVQVQAHVRRIQRPRSPKVCRYLHIPGVVTATPAPRLMAKSTLGVSVVDGSRAGQIPLRSSDRTLMPGVAASGGPPLPRDSDRWVTENHAPGRACRAGAAGVPDG